MPYPWYQQPFRIFQTNLREIDAGLDVSHLLDQLEHFYASAWLLNTGGIVSFYPSRLPFQHPSPWLAERPSGDLVADALQGAHARGLRLISRVDFSKLHADQYERHPDWFVHNRQNQPQIYNGLYSTCPSGPYYQEHSLTILNEILERYPIDGLFFNMFTFADWDYSGVYHGICHCTHCRRRFKDFAGLELPSEESPADPTWADYLDFRRRTVHQLSQRISEFIHDKNPHTALVLFGDAGQGDVIVYEINNAVQRSLPFWAHQAGEMMKRAQGERPGTPVTLNSVLFLDIPYRFAAEQPMHVGLRLAQTIAHGGSPYIYVIGTPDQLDRRNHAICREMYAFHQREEADYDKLVSPAEIALIDPQRARLLHPGGAEARLAAQTAFRGLYRCLVEAHRQFDVLTEARLAEMEAQDRLSRYRLLILPAAACLSAAEAAALDAFVARGGRLLATWDTALYDERGRTQAEFALASLAAARLLHFQPDTRGAYFRVGLDEASLLGEFAGQTDLLALIGGYLYTELRLNASASLPRLPAMRYGPPEKCYGEGEPTAWQAVLWGEHGAGRSAYLPWRPGWLFESLSLPEYAAVLGQVVRRLLPDPPLVELEALEQPAAARQVEAVLRDQPPRGRRILHLVNFNGVNGRRFYGPLDTGPLRLRVRTLEPIQKVRAARLDRELPFEAYPGGVAFDLPGLGLFEKIVLEAG